MVTIVTKKLTKILLAVSFAILSLQTIQAQTNKSESVNRLFDLPANFHPALTEANWRKKSLVRIDILPKKGGIMQVFLLIKSKKILN